MTKQGFDGLVGIVQNLLPMAMVVLHVGRCEVHVVGVQVHKHFSCGDNAGEFCDAVVEHLEAKAVDGTHDVLFQGFVG